MISGEAQTEYIRTKYRAVALHLPIYYGSIFYQAINMKYLTLFSLISMLKLTLACSICDDDTFDLSARDIYDRDIYERDLYERALYEDFIPSYYSRRDLLARQLDKDNDRVLSKRIPKSTPCAKCGKQMGDDKFTVVEKVKGVREYWHHQCAKAAGLTEY